MKPRQIPPPDPSVKFTELTPLQLNALHLADKRTLLTPSCSSRWLPDAPPKPEHRQGIKRYSL